MIYFELAVSEVRSFSIFNFNNTRVRSDTYILMIVSTEKLAVNTF